VKEFVLRYPGNPPAKVLRVNREEFFKIYPPETRVVMVGHARHPQDATVIPMGTELACHHCNANLEDEIYLVYDSAYCPKCACENLLRWCTAV
jgi:hypothetical protein